MLRKQRVKIKCAQDWREFPNCRTSLYKITRTLASTIIVMSATSSTCTNPTESCNFKSDAQCCKKMTTGTYAGSCPVTGASGPPYIDPDGPEAASIDACFNSTGYAADNGSSFPAARLTNNQTHKTQQILMVASTEFDHLGATATAASASAPTNSPDSGKDKRSVALAAAGGVVVGVVAMVAIFVAWNWRTRRLGSQVTEERQPLDVENVAVTSMQ
jgi:hypothetical protein